MNDKINQNGVMNGKFVKNLVMDAKIDPEVVMDLSVFKIGGWNSLQCAWYALESHERVRSARASSNFSQSRHHGC